MEKAKPTDIKLTNDGRENLRRLALLLENIPSEEYFAVHDKKFQWDFGDVLYRTASCHYMGCAIGYAELYFNPVKRSGERVGDRWQRLFDMEMPLFASLFGTCGYDVTHKEVTPRMVANKINDYLKT